MAVKLARLFILSELAMRSGSAFAGGRLSSFTNDGRSNNANLLWEPALGLALRTAELPDLRNNRKARAIAISKPITAAMGATMLTVDVPEEFGLGD